MIVNKETIAEHEDESVMSVYLRIRGILLTVACLPLIVNRIVSVMATSIEEGPAAEYLSTVVRSSGRRVVSATAKTTLSLFVMQYASSDRLYRALNQFATHL